MLTLAMIRSYQDTGDQALAEEMAYATLLCTDMQDAYILLGRAPGRRTMPAGSPAAGIRSVFSS